MDKIDKAMAQAVSQGVFPGAQLLCAKAGTILFHKAFGRADLSTGRVVTHHTLFDLASLTKPLATALAVADLAARGRLDLDTCLADLIDEAKETDKAGITLDMLLRHTAGLPAHRPYFKTLDGPLQGRRPLLRRCLLAEPLESRPGQREVYSDLGYMMLSWVVEQVSGQRLDHFVGERIYSPLGLTDLLFIDLAGERPGHEIAATQDCPWRGRLLTGEVEDENAWAVGGVEGHAGLFGTAFSVYQVCFEILNALRGDAPAVLAPDVISRFVRPHENRVRVAGFDRPSRENSSAGAYLSKGSLGHLGYTGTSFWITPETGLIIVLLTNRVHPSRDNLKIREFRPLIHDLICLELN